MRTKHKFYQLKSDSRKKSTLLLVLFVGGLSAGLGWLAIGGREPSYQGKSLSTWLTEGRERGENNDLLVEDQIETKTAVALRAMGVKALPTLLRRVRLKDSRTRELLRKFAENFPGLELHVRRFSELQEETAFAFAVLGPSAKPAVPRLLRLLKDRNPEVRVMAAFCLGCIGPVSKEMVPALADYAARAVQNTNWEAEERFIATYSLYRFGKSALPALPQIQALANDPNLDAERGGMAKATLILVSGQSAAPFIEPLIDPSDFTNWFSAALVVRWLGPEAVPAVPALISALKQTNEQAQATALETLGRIHAAPEICLPAITPFLHSKTARIRLAALEALRRFKGASLDAWTLKEITACLQDGDRGVSDCAAGALRSLAPEAAVKAGLEP